VPRLAVSVFGGVQPDRLGSLLAEADDGLLARLLWLWPDPIIFRLSRQAPRIAWAIEALDRLRWLDLLPGDPAQPVMVPLAPEALALMEEFARAAQVKQAASAGLMRSALGKARGLALRLSLVFEMLWWAGSTAMSPPPTTISERAFAAAATLLEDYVFPMAERVYGDAAATRQERKAATLARWIIREKPEEVYVRALQRDVRLPGLTTADAIHEAAQALVEADWLAEPAKGGQARRARAAYPINPRVWEAAQ
jgi:hypothetical protein